MSERRFDETEVDDLSEMRRFRERKKISGAPAAREERSVGVLV
jgi:hypothetical protein